MKNVIIWGILISLQLGLAYFAYTHPEKIVNIQISIKETQNINRIVK